MPAREDALQSHATVGVVTTALILAAGNGDRFQCPVRRSKLLHPFLGEPLLVHTLRGVRAAGLTRAEIVTGYDAARLRRVLASHTIDGLEVGFVHNPEWRLENGVSALAAASRLSDRRFALLMGDHLFDPAVLARLTRSPAPSGASLLAVDGSTAAPEVAAEATRVRLAGNRIVAIGKELTPFDALDTGLFVCAPTLFPMLVEARAHGETTLSAGIRRLAARGLMYAVDVRGAAWHDIDTRADLLAAEAATRAAFQVVA